MSYINDALAPGERVIERAQLHWVVWIPAWLFLIFLGVFLVGIILFVREWLRLTNIEAAVTDRRLIRKTGWIERRVTDLDLDAVEVIDIEQSFLGRLLGFGRVNAHGTGDDIWKSPLIADPVGFRRQIAVAQNGRPQNAA